MQSMLGKKTSADNIFSLLPENRVWHFKTICIKCQKPYFQEKQTNKRKYQSVICWITPETAKG